MENNVPQENIPHNNLLLDTLKRYKIFFFVLLVIVLIVPTLILFFLSIQTPSSQPSPEPITPFPTVFPTEPLPNSLTPTLTFEEQTEVQSVADRDYADWQKNVTDTYPWYNNLPLQTSTYFVYFDLDKKSFIAKLYPSGNQTEAVLKAEILERLEALTIDTNQYPIEWSNDN